MRGVFDGEEQQPVQQRRDAELTLGFTLQLIVFFVIVVLCGLCFALGYTMGSHSSPDGLAAGQQPGAGTSSPTAGSRPKPSAVPQANPQPVPQRAVVSLPPSASDTNPPSNVQPPSSNNASANSAQWVVKPALPTQAGQLPATQPQPAPALPASANKVLPATAPAGSLMVQIAAVSHQEDADVLVSALRKRGYAVTMRREAGDSMVHVQVGPFATRNDAFAMRQKLLNDGYNAIVQQ